jgi:hypothetical protein
MGLPCLKCSKSISIHNYEYFPLNGVKKQGNEKLPFMSTYKVQFPRTVLQGWEHVIYKQSTFNDTLISRYTLQVLNGKK